ncbi:AMP-binding protein, partial [Mycobacterium sp. 663a-19]|uniref:AMP-binding protein n=1 Tax=Mycobacterium sp. 663a-19 TaxID=2986148 RepID=UPI002D1F233A
MEHDERALPLTRGQLDMWLAQESGRAGTDLQLGILLKIDGPVDRDLLQRAIGQAVQEAEPWRAGFFEADGRVFQRAVDYSDVDLAFYDLSGSGDPVREAREIASSIQRTPMPLTGPLFRFALFRTGNEEYYWFNCYHHIAIDGLGIALVGRRAATIYSAIVSGDSISPSFFGSLQDLVRGESEYEASNDYLQDRAYWTQNLPLESGPDYRLSEAVGDRDSLAAAPVEVAQFVVARTKELSKVLRIRRYSVITAACALLVRGFCGVGSEVALDFTVARRVRPESKTLPAMLVGVVPLVLKVSPGCSIADFCRHVDARIRELLQHQRFPVRVLEGEGGHRDLSRATKRVTVNFIPSVLTLDLAGVPATAMYTDHGLVSHFGLFFLGAGDQLFLNTAGAGQPFANFDVSNLVARLERVLVAMTADPMRALSSIDVLDAGEHARLDEIGHRAVLGAPGPAAVSIPVLWAAQVGRSPDAVALVCGGGSWTYGEVERASNRLAQLLIGRGVGPGDVVALLFERCAEAVIAMLGVLKTGAAYVPMAPDHPDALIGFVVADAAPVAVITTAGLRSRLAGHDVAVIEVEDPVIDTCPDSAPPAVAADNVAYLIYTSGTTGVPKGVAVSHVGIADLVASHAERLAITPDSRVLQFAPLIFDMSVGNLWWALLTGAAAVIPTEEQAVPGRELTDLMARQRVSHAKFTPSMLAALPAEQLCGLTLITGGEVCTAELVDRYAAVATLVNEYGPTETTVDVTIGYPLAPGSGAAPIGSPVLGAALFVLDGWLRAVPVGVVGELYVAGAGVG